ncbi:response regulator transcription factor [Runella slithyformis]|uniref:Two component transcriptional regulator, winged helix family n=1 Tax=Runella slithyformis (strain ATCC 29530 / DSM 19594 / LMG 11500 / NCIMB 11436 / LSU 4) TaxID=761193 RepID=A0A7U3ZMT6_RUNSL|nr:response regulator transcription factor [Runella slithyformis]AEI50057.1 two component transcriptional regulator, winged helix family [Runella slithyformis DSM 19594]
MDFIPHLLLVEDEIKVAAFIKKGLERQGFTVDIAEEGLKGKQLFEERTYDLIILDVNLPNMDGVTLAAHVRTQNTQIPVLMLTALDTTADKLAGFDAGVDDYLVKPFDFMELVARLKALLKRAVKSAEPTNILRVADLELDLDQKLARRNGQTIELTAKEFALLEYLMRNRGRVVSKVDIAEKVWDIDFDTGTNFIEVYINYLRKKIEKDTSNKLIHTVVGMGYTLKEK